MSARDPRGYITPDAFRVAPHLLGLPLASPSRRAAAMTVDLLLVGFLVAVGGGVLFGLAAGALFFKVASGRLGSRLPRPARGALRLGGAAVLFVVGINAWDGIGGDAGSASEAGTLGKVVSGVQAGSAFTKLDGAGSRAEADAELTRAVASLRATGADDDAVAAAVREISTDAGSRWAREAAGALLPTLRAKPTEVSEAEPDTAMEPDALARAWAAALASGDTVAAAALRPRLAADVAADTLSAMQRRVEGLERERTELRQARDRARADVERMEKTGLLSMLRRVADELGLEFGWTGLYFTAFLAFWKGQTPGKRMLGMRVVRLDGKPMGLWSSFERFGGYAASLVTGLLGFVQIFWDRNRQGMHDKIVETVVVRLIPGIEELTREAAQAAAAPPLTAPDRRGVPPRP